MAETRSLSVFLLKDAYAEPAQALKPDHGLTKAVTKATAGHQWPIYLAQSTTSAPWWRNYFSITNPISRGYAGALVFIKATKKTFALTFGQTRHSLRDEAYEYDFGLRTTLNAVDPKKIRNMDEVQPATARRRRTQVPERSDISYFDFDGESAILRSLTGAIRDEHKRLFTHVTGAGSLKISTKKPAGELIPLLDKLYEIYQKRTYLEAFPAANNIQPVKDPATLSLLDEKLVEALRKKHESLVLTIPELVDFQEDFEVFFSGRGSSDLYSDATLADYYGYIEKKASKASEVNLQELHRDRLRIRSSDGTPLPGYSIYRCLVYETVLEGTAETFHLNEGNWYQVDTAYLSKLKKDLEPYFEISDLPPRNERLEHDYNREKLVPHWKGSILLDREDTSPPGQTAIEPCDVARVENGYLVLTHVKRGVEASALSHLFSQGATAVDLLNGDAESREQLGKLLKKQAEGFDLTPLKERNFKVEYVVTTKKDPRLASEALPLFSRISLRRACRSLSSMKTSATVHLVEDTYARTKRPKPRKQSSKKKEPEDS